MEVMQVVVFSLLGGVISVLLACVPGVHIYGVVAVSVAGVSVFGSVTPEKLVPFCAGLITAYAVVGAVPSVLLSTPDESAFFAVLPGRKYLKRGRGYEAVMLMAIGGFAGLLWVCLVMGLAAPVVLGMLVSVIRLHMHWMVWCVICFMLLSEWPKGGRYAYGVRERLADAWGPLLSGIVTFLLSGALGMLLFFRSPLSMEGAFQNLLPAFSGLFTLPWMLVNIISGAGMPEQEIRMRKVRLGQICSGGLAGICGGSFAALIPGVTGGVGGMLAGHASALRDDKAFLVSQGASRSVYYIGSFLFFFVPAASITRGGAACMLRGIYMPGSFHDYNMVLAAMAISGSATLFLLSPATRITVKIVRRIGYRRMSIAGACIAIVLVFMFTGFEGLLVMLTALGVGMLPLLYGSRRMNCLGVILLPVALLL